MKILELENTISKMKILLNGLTIRLVTTEEKLVNLKTLKWKQGKSKHTGKKKTDKKMNDEPLEPLVICRTK